MNETKKPAIRFREFSEEWEQSKLGELAIFNPKEELPNTFEYVDLESVVGTEMVFHRTETKQTAPSRAQRLAHIGDLFYQTVRPYQKNNYLFEKDDSDYVFSTGYAQLRPLVNGYFLLSVVQNERFVKRVMENCTGTSYPAINANILSELKVYITKNKNNYELIASFFRNLDNLIIFYQRKYDRLVCVKKSMLEKMFPKDGADVPEVRFKGFSGTWERAQLENYLSVSNEKNTSDTYDKTDVLSVSGDYGIVNQIEFQGRSFAGVSVSNYGIVHTGDIVYTKSPLSSNPYGIIKTNKGKTGIVSTLYAVYHTKTNTFPDFVQVYFEQHARMNNYMHPLVNKGAKNDMKVSAENALKGTVIFPDYREQKAISVFFAKLDHLIALQQQELDKLQSLKKALLEKMFV